LCSNQLSYDRRDGSAKFATTLGTVNF